MGSFDFADGSFHEPFAALRMTLWKDFNKRRGVCCARDDSVEGPSTQKSGEPKLPKVKRTEAMFN
jgi:hypothetical protein